MLGAAGKRINENKYLNSISLYMDTIYLKKKTHILLLEFTNTHICWCYESRSLEILIAHLPCIHKPLHQVRSEVGVPWKELFSFFRAQLFIECVTKEIEWKKNQSPHHHQTLQILLSLLLLSSQLGQQWWPGQPQRRLLMLTLAKAFANKPGQKGSTFIPAAFFFLLIN